MALRLLLILCLAGSATLATPPISKPLDVPFVRQQKNGCGAAAIAMVFDYWARQYPLSETAKPSPTEIYEQLYREQLRAIRLSDMRTYVEHHGFQSFTLTGRMSDLEEQLAKGRPLIVGLRKKPRSNLHFAVVSGLGPEGVWLHDPTRRKPTHIDRSKFEKRWALADNWLLLAVPRPTR